MSKDGVAAAAETEDRLKSLVALRTKLAQSIDECDSLRDLAALSARFQNVLEEISELTPPVEEKGDAVDEIARRRAARRTSTA